MDTDHERSTDVVGNNKSKVLPEFSSVVARRDVFSILTLYLQQRRSVYYQNLNQNQNLNQTQCGFLKNNENYRMEL